MESIREGPLNNVIQEGIKEDIEVALANCRLRAAVMLMYAGMDAMAFLDMPDGQEDVTRSDFIRWADRYIRFPCKDQISGEDFYGARCALLHSYSANRQRIVDLEGFAVRHRMTSRKVGGHRQRPRG
jgi:hypothetical protein